MTELSIDEMNRIPKELSLEIKILDLYMSSFYRPRIGNILQINCMQSKAPFRHIVPQSLLTLDLSHFDRIDVFLRYEYLRKENKHLDRIFKINHHNIRIQINPSNFVDHDIEIHLSNHKRVKIVNLVHNDECEQCTAETRTSFIKYSDLPTMTKDEFINNFYTPRIGATRDEAFFKELASYYINGTLVFMPEKSSNWHLVQKGILELKRQYNQFLLDNNL